MNLKHATAQRTGLRRGFTLVELIVSMAIMGVLLLAMASAIVIAAHALPDPDRPTTRLIKSSEVLRDMLAELEEARYVTAHDDGSIAFTVSDRDGDRSADRIRYTWSGTAGDPLYRAYNGGTPAAVIDSVEDLTLSYDYTSVTEEYPGAPVEDAERLLGHYDEVRYLDDQTINETKWSGQYVEPYLPAEATAYRVTRVYFLMRAYGSKSGVNYVEIRPADDNHLPTDTILYRSILYESALADLTYSWTMINFAEAPPIAASDPFCLVIRPDNNGGDTAKILLVDYDGSGRLRCDSGVWRTYTSDVLYHYVYGRPLRPGATQTATRHYLTAAHVRLQVAAADIPLDASVRFLNTPEVLSAVWENEFDDLPQFDLNGDGQPDWVVSDGSIFDENKLKDGVWSADQMIDTTPGCDFQKITIVEVAMRQTAASTSGAGFWINADRSGSSVTGISVTVNLESDQTQTLKLRFLQTDGSIKAVKTVTGFPLDFVKVRLLIDPDRNTVNLQANGVSQGTLVYPLRSPWDANRWATLAPYGNACEYDYVRIRVVGDLP